MKKKLFAVLTCAIFCAAVTSCTNKEQQPSLSSNEDNEGSNSFSQFQDNNEIPSPLETGFVNLSKPYTSVLGSGAEGGFYETRAAENNAANVVYIDYASAKEIFLCAVPNCIHNSTACNSWIPSDEAGMFPIVAGDHLLLIKRTYGNEEGKQAIPRIETVELDGSNRKVLIEFSASEYLGDVFSSNESVLICSITTRDNSNTVNTSLISIDLSTGKRTDFYKTSTNGNSEKVYYGTSKDGYCVFRELVQAKTAADFPDLNEKEAIMEAAKSVEQIWYAVPMGINVETEINRGSANVVANEVCETGLFMFDCVSKELTLTNIKNGATQTIATIQEENIERAFFNGTIDDWLILDISNRINSDDVIENRYAINVNDGTIKKLTIMCSYGKSTVTPFILGHDNDFVLLVSENSGSGGLHFGLDFSVLPKSDYLASISKNMKKIAFI